MPVVAMYNFQLRALHLGSTFGAWRMTRLGMVKILTLNTAKIIFGHWKDCILRHWTFCKKWIFEKIPFFCHFVQANVQAILNLLNLAQKVPFWRIWRKSFWSDCNQDILCMLPKYIIVHGFKSPLGQKMPWFWPKTIIFHFSKIHIFGCFKGFWRSNWNSKTSFII